MRTLQELQTQAKTKEKGYLKITLTDLAKRDRLERILRDLQSYHFGDEIPDPTNLSFNPDDLNRMRNKVNRIVQKYREYIHKDLLNAIETLNSLWKEKIYKIYKVIPYDDPQDFVRETFAKIHNGNSCMQLNGSYEYRHKKGMEFYVLTDEKNTIQGRFFMIKNCIVNLYLHKRGYNALYGMDGEICINRKTWSLKELIHREPREGFNGFYLNDIYAPDENSLMKCMEFFDRHYSGYIEYCYICGMGMRKDEIYEVDGQPVCEDCYDNSELIAFCNYCQEPHITTITNMVRVYLQEGVYNSCYFRELR